MSNSYTPLQIQQILPLSKLENNSIQREFVFKDFKSAITFMVNVAFYAEKLDHHPEWSNVYNKVFIKLRTHSVSDLTEKDIELAKIIDSI